MKKIRTNILLDEQNLDFVKKCDINLSQLVRDKLYEMENINKVYQFHLNKVKELGKIRDKNKYIFFTEKVPLLRSHGCDDKYILDRYNHNFEENITTEELNAEIEKIKNTETFINPN